MESPPAAAEDAGEVWYQCLHCREVVTPSLAQIELAENAPEADPAIKCPHCHKYAVHRRFPARSELRPQPKPVSLEHGHELFAGIFRMLAKH